MAINFPSVIYGQRLFITVLQELDFLPKFGMFIR